MSTWESRSKEERALLNPAFCSTLIWAAAKARASNAAVPLSIEESFLILPLILPANTRDALPATTRTSLPTWLDENPVEHQRIPQRAKALLPFSRLALNFGASRNLINLDGKVIRANEDWGKQIHSMLKQTSEEVRRCVTRAEFVSKWFEGAGTPATVLALLGVRP